MGKHSANIPWSKDNRNIFKKADIDVVLKYILYFMSSLFIISLVRLSVLIPTLFRETSLAKFDPYYGIEGWGSNENSYFSRVLMLLISENGLVNISNIPIILFFIYGAILFAFVDDKEIISLWNKVLSWSISAAALLLTIASTWRG